MGLKRKIIAKSSFILGAFKHENNQPKWLKASNLGVIADRKPFIIV